MVDWHVFLMFKQQSMHIGFVYVLLYSMIYVMIFELMWAPKLKYAHVEKNPSGLN